MDLTKQFEELSGELKDLVIKQNDEIKSHGKSTSETSKKLSEVEKKYNEAVADLSTNNTEMKKRIEELEKKAGRMGMGSSDQKLKLSAADQFIISKQYENAKNSGRNTVDSVTMNSVFKARYATAEEIKQLADLVGDAAVGEALVQPERDMNIYRDPNYRINHVRDIMNVTTTQSDAVEYIQHVDKFAQAASQEGQFGTKNQTELEFKLEKAPVETIASWIPVSRQILSDAGMLKSYIDNELLHALRVEEDRQVLFGDGQDNDLTGIFNTTGVQDQGFLTGTDNKVDQIRRAMAKVRVDHYMSTGVMLNPEDWADIELLKDSNDGQYLYAVVSNVAAGAQPVLYRVPVIESTAMNKDEFLTGDFQMGARIFDREQSNIRVSEHHADYFIKNGVAILAEERLALTVNRPKAFCKGSLIADPGA